MPLPIVYKPEPEEEVAPTPTPTPAIVTGAYITHKNPTPRDTDTTLGKIMGYLSELLEWLRWENYAFVVDSVFPDTFPFNTVQSLLIAVCKALYERIYQQAYNRGADRGNEINSQILSWLDTLKNEAYTKIDEARNYIETNLINPIKNTIDTYITPKLKDAESKLSTMTTQINNTVAKVNEMVSRINSMGSQIDAFGTTLESYRSKLNEIVEIANTLQTRLKDAENFLQDLDRRVKALEQAKALPFQLPKILGE